MKRLVFLVTAIVLLVSSFANPYQTIDSLKQEIENTHEIGDKISLYRHLSEAYKTLDVDTAIQIAHLAVKLAEKTNSIKDLGLLYSSIGDFALIQDSSSKAEQAYQQALSYLIQVEKSRALAKVYMAIGSRSIERDNFPEAMDYYLKGVRIAEELGDSTQLPSFYNNLGVIYLNLNKHEKALELYTKALKLFELDQSSMNIAGTTTNIGSIYIKLGDLDIARTYYQKGYTLFETAANMEGMAHALLKLGLLDIMQQQYTEAKDHLRQCIAILKQLDIVRSGSKSIFMAETKINLGLVYIALDNYNEAEALLSEGFEVAFSGGHLGLIALSSEGLSDLYKKKMQADKALHYHELFKIYSDSIYNEENIRRLTQLEMQYQFDTKLKENELERERAQQEQERKNLVYIILFGGLFLVLIILVLLLTLEKNKKKKVELERTNLKNKLEHTNKELTTYVMYLLRKNEFIISISEKLKKTRLDAKPENKKVLAELIHELESNSSMISWEEFEVRFQQVYTGFYKSLNDQFPDLTPNELRLCAFFRLNMTTKEIAAITYQSINSITVARYRLRKKLGLESEENLVSFLMKL